MSGKQERTTSESLKFASLIYRILKSCKTISLRKNCIGKGIRFDRSFVLPQIPLKRKC